ncbi:PQQ-dependent sugar dehydrogenase [Emticicia fontis]
MLYGQYNTFYLSPAHSLINVGQSVNLTASGCTGSVTWSTGQTGTSISVSPASTTKISANCSTSGGSNNEIIVEVIPCADNVVVNTGLTSGTHVFEANNVTGTSFINASTNVHFKAAKGVALNTGFEAKPGSIFKATIEACHDTSYLQTRRVANKLNFPWEILWGPDNYIWMTERSGKISRVNPQNGQIISVFTVPDVLNNGEGGLLGMVLHPDFSNSPYVYVVHNYTNGSSQEKVVRYTYNGTTLESPQILLDNIAGNTIHNGSRLLITPDLKLFITTGDAGNGNLSQDSTSVNGKILRINLDGSIPADNPYAGSPVWSIGHRNSQGMVYANNKLYVSSHGGSIEDEINLIQKKRNYGWPTVEGPCNTPSEITFCANNNVVEPIFSSGGSTWAFCGLDYYNNNAYPAWQNHLLMVSLKNQTFYSFELSGDGNTIIGQPTLYYASQFGRLRDIAISPDGKVYICTSNGGNNDQLVEIKPMSY